MNYREIITKSAEETIAEGARWAKALSAGAVITLTGNLGAGKTTLIKGIASGLGLSDIDLVTSPTFTVMNIYETSPPLYHFDLYRLEDPKQVLAIGFDEFIDNPKVISCVEWPEKAAGLIPDHACAISIEDMGNGQRKLKLPVLIEKMKAR